jgi:hypothetical protein
MTYARLAPSGRIIPSVEHCGELQWKLRYAQDNITKQDMLVIAHYLSQYAAFHEQTNKHRNEWFKEYKLVWEDEV